MIYLYIYIYIYRYDYLVKFIIPDNLMKFKFYFDLCTFTLTFIHVYYYPTFLNLPVLLKPTAGWVLSCRGWSARDAVWEMVVYIYIYVWIFILSISRDIHTVCRHDFLNAQQFQRDADGSLTLGSAIKHVWILVYIL